jgi:hypothetical protein
MADSYSCAMIAQCTVTETLGATNDLLFASSGSRQVVHNQFNGTATLNGTSTPAVSKVVSFRQALTDGSASLDLNSLTGTHGASVDGASLKVQAVLLKAASGNSAAITFKDGDANGYKLAGVDSWLIPLSPGGYCVWWNGSDTGDDITNGSLDTITLSGTGTDSLDITICMG